MILTIKGFRLNWTISEIQRSISVLTSPLTSDEIAGGWDEDTRALMISSYRQVLDEIREGNVSRRQYRSWIRGLDDITKAALESRSASTAGDDAVLSLADAQCALEILQGANEDPKLQTPPFDEYRSFLSSMIQTLQTGNFLSLEMTSMPRDPVAENESPVFEDVKESLALVVDRDRVHFFGHAR